MSTTILTSDLPSVDTMADLLAPTHPQAAEAMRTAPDVTVRRVVDDSRSIHLGDGEGRTLGVLAYSAAWVIAGWSHAARTTAWTLTQVTIGGTYSGEGDVEVRTYASYGALDADDVAAVARLAARDAIPTLVQEVSL